MSHFNAAVFSHTPDEIDQLLAPFQEDVDAASPYAEFVENESADMDESTGKKGYWHNPNATYDWYECGGRWRGMLKLRQGAQGNRAAFDQYDRPFQYPDDRCDQARVADCDFSRDEAAYQKALRCWDVLVEGAEPTEEEKKQLLFHDQPEYYRRRYGTKERYAENMSAFLPYAYVTTDGAWHGQGHMGYFGCDNATLESVATFEREFSAYLEQAKREGLMISMYDFHI